MRVSKPPEERRREILTTAMRLFAQKGIERTSVNDIVKAIGVAQGLFYYYFKSKEAMLDAVLDEYTIIMRADLQFILDDKAADFFEKLACVILLICSYVTDEGGRLATLLNAPPNNALYARAVQRAIDQSIEMLETLLMQGVRASKARVEYPGLALKILFQGVNAVLLKEKVPGGNILSIAERMLGITPGMLKRYSGLFDTASLTNGQ